MFSEAQGMTEVMMRMNEMASYQGGCLPEGTHNAFDMIQ
jgi:hypothetical protein